MKSVFPPAFQRCLGPGSWCSFNELVLDKLPFSYNNGISVLSLLSLLYQYGLINGLQIGFGLCAHLEKDGTVLAILFL